MLERGGERVAAAASNARAGLSQLAVTTRAIASISAQSQCYQAVAMSATSALILKSESPRREGTRLAPVLFVAHSVLVIAARSSDVPDIVAGPRQAPNASPQPAVLARLETTPKTPATRFTTQETKPAATIGRCSPTTMGEP